MITLDWSSRGPDGAATVLRNSLPCGICHRPTLLLSPRNKKPCHKVCAEAWLNNHRSQKEGAVTEWGLIANPAST